MKLSVICVASFVSRIVLYGRERGKCAGVPVGVEENGPMWWKDRYCVRRLSSMYALGNCLYALDPYNAYLQWFKGQVEDGKTVLPFLHRNILDWIRYLVH